MSMRGSLSMKTAAWSRRRSPASRSRWAKQLAVASYSPKVTTTPPVAITIAGSSGCVLAASAAYMAAPYPESGPVAPAEPSQLVLRSGEQGGSSGGQDVRTRAGPHEVGSQAAVRVGEGHSCRRVSPADLAVGAGVTEGAGRVGFPEGRVAQGVLSVITGEHQPDGAVDRNAEHGIGEGASDACGPVDEDIRSPQCARVAEQRLIEEREIGGGHDPAASGDACLSHRG